MYWIVGGGSDVMVGASANWSIRRGKAVYISGAQHERLDASCKVHSTKRRSLMAIGS